MTVKLRNTEKSGKPELRVASVDDIRLWIWKLIFGIPDALNDLSIPDYFQLFETVCSGIWRVNHLHIYIAGRMVDWFCLGVEGIFPPFKIF